jgi:hypothetical protein
MTIVSLSFLATILVGRGFEVSPVDTWGRIRVNVKGADVGMCSVRNGGSVEVSVLGSSVDNRFSLLSARSCVGADTAAEAAATIARWLTA